MDGDCGHGWGYHNDGPSGLCYKCLEVDVAKKTVKVVQDEEKPIETSVLAKAIVDMSAAAKRLSQSGLNRKAITLLIAHDAGLGQGTVKAILDSLEHLQSTYLSK